MNHDTEIRPLPSNVYVERMILGSILLNDQQFVDCAGLAVDDFSLQKHRTIWRRMLDLDAAGKKIDHVTLAEELMRRGELESVDGLSYLVETEEGLPELFNLPSYAGIVREKAKARRLIFAAREAQERAFAGQDTTEEIIGHLVETVADLDSNDAGSGMLSAAEIIERAPGGVDGLLAGKERGIPTGFYRYDAMTGGLTPGTLVVIAARPAMGKTALAMNIAANIALANKPSSVGVFSLEMDRESLTGRMICSEANVDSAKTRLGFVDSDESAQLSEAAARIYAAPIFIDDLSGQSLMGMRAQVRRLKARLIRESKPPLRVVIVDYLQLMESADSGKESNRVEQVSAITRGLKIIAKDEHLALVALSQLSRKCEERTEHRGQLADLRESGSIEQDADIVNFIFRPEVYAVEEREDLRGVAELSVAKQRNGPTGKVNLLFFKEFTKFVNAAEDGRTE